MKLKNKQINNTYVVQPIFEEQFKKNPVILRVVLSKEFTRIDFGYAAPWIYNKGGWIHIAPETFIKVKSNNERFKLSKAINIPIAPDRIDFESTEDWRVFSLYFEPIPINDCMIDIIEDENPDENNFNYYNIELKNVKDLEQVIEE